jgi:hypothetical protein
MKNRFVLEIKKIGIKCQVKSIEFLLVFLSVNEEIFVLRIKHNCFRVNGIFCWVAIKCKIQLMN